MAEEMAAGLCACGCNGLIATVTVNLTTSKRRRAGAGLLALAAVALYAFWPEAFWASEYVPAAAALFFPLYWLAPIASLLLDFTAKRAAARRAIKAGAALGCLLAIFYASEVLAEQHFWVLLSSNPGAFALGLGIVAALCLLFFAATGSLPWAVRGAAIVVALFSYVNHFTVLFRGTPFIPQDFFGLGTAATVFSSYSLSFTGQAAEALLVLIGVFLIAPRLTFPWPAARLRRWTLRAGSLTVAVAFLAITMSKPFIVACGLEPFYFEQWQSAAANGSIANFLANIADSSADPPEGYSPAQAAAIAAEYPSDSASAAQAKPDVVVILGESWADIVPEGRVRTDRPITPFIDSLSGRDDAWLGDLIVSSKGGGTSRQEFQFLTGANDEYGLHTAPFLFLVDEQLPNLTRSFKQLGYSTTALHTGSASAWNRDTALPDMGFDQFLAAGDMGYADAPYLRTYLRDSVLYDRTLELLDQAVGPTFIYAITIHTHGGYGDEDYQADVHITEPQGEYAQTEQYLSLLNAADADLQAFITALEGRERPTLVLFFGDHLPSFENSYDEDVLEGSDPFWRYQTFYGLWANYRLPDTALTDSDDAPISLSHLGPYLMQTAGLPLTGYQKFLLACAKEYPVASIIGFMDADGSIIDTDEAAATEAYRRQAIVQYNYVYDRGNMPEGFFTLGP